MTRHAPDRAPFTPATAAGADRRTFVGQALGLGLGLLGATNAQAQPAFPNKPVRVIVPTAAGSGSDVLSRAICDRLSQAWGQPVIVDNRAGASGMLGVEAVARAAPDGYTLLMTSASPVTINPMLFRKLPYDPERAVTPISRIGYSQSALMVNGNVPARTLAELIALAKSKPGALSYGSFGMGSGGHLALELFCQLAGVTMTHVPYKGTAPAMTDLLGGQISVMLNDPLGSQAHLEQGRLRALAVNGPKRHALYPSVPTFVELGFAPMEGTYASFSVLATYGTPAAVVEKISADMRQVLAIPELNAKFGPQGYVLKGSTPAELAAAMSADRERWGAVIRAIGGLSLD